MERLWCGRCTSVADGRPLQCLRAHSDVVTCVALSEDGSTLVSGSRDTTSMVWSVGRQALADKPRLVLYGHDDEVRARGRSIWSLSTWSAPRLAPHIAHRVATFRLASGCSASMPLRMVQKTPCRLVQSHCCTARAT
eukprot:6196889-Pleurochrysis_carterae.AAC.1